MVGTYRTTNPQLFRKMLEVMVPMYVAAKGTLAEGGITWNDIEEDQLGSAISNMKTKIKKGIWKVPQGTTLKTLKLGQGMFYPQFMALRAVMPTVAKLTAEYADETINEPLLYENFETKLEARR